MLSDRYNAIKNKLITQKQSSGQTAVNQTNASSARSDRFNRVKERLNSGGFTSSVDESFVDSFLRDSSSFIEQTQKDYKGLTWQSGTSKEAQEVRRAADEDFTIRAGKVRTFLNANKNRLSPETLDTYLQYLDDFSDFKSQMSRSFEKAYSNFAKFETEEEYNQAVENASWQKKYSGKSYSELQSILSSMDEGGEKDWLTNYARSVMTRLDTTKALQSTKGELGMVIALQDERNRLKMQYAPGMEGWDQALSRMSEISWQFGNLDDRIQALKEDIWALERDEKYKFLSENEDYDEMSQVRAHGDLFSEAVHNATHKNLQHMTKDERADYNYLYATEGKAAAEDYLEWLQYTLDKRSMDQKLTWVSEATQSVPVLSQTVASLLRTPISLLGITGLADVAVQKIQNAVTGENKPINYNTDAMFYSKAASEIGRTVAQNITDATGVINLDEEKHPYLSRVLNGKGWADVYQFGMNLQDSAAIAGLALIHPALGKAGTVLLGGSAGTQSMLDAVARGATDEQALTMGILSGAFEMIFEKYELDHLLGADTNVCKAIGNQVLSEAIGESATELSNILADTVVMAQNSNFEQNILRYLAENPTWDYNQAKKRAFIDAALQVAEAGVGGGLSGGIMGGGMSFIKKATATA